MKPLSEKMRDCIVEAYERLPRGPRGCVGRYHLRQLADECGLTIQQVYEVVRRRKKKEKRKSS